MSSATEQPALLTRLAELYSAGGVSEVSRGIRDYLRITVAPALEARVRSKATLSAGPTTVRIGIASGDDVRRARDRNEPAVRRDLAETVTDTDVVWDVGANIGVHTLVACAAGARKVVAFEPGADARDQLLRNLRRNGFAAAIRPYALGAEATDAVLADGEHRGARKVTTGGAGEAVQVRVGDEVRGPAPDVLKVDVEGAEVGVLDGVEERLQDVRVAYVEVHGGVSESAVTARLDDAGLTERTRVDGLIRASR